MVKRLLAAALGLSILGSAGCGGSRIQVNLLSQSATLSARDTFTTGPYYYDTWTFVPTKSDRAVFKMLSNDVEGFIILKDDQGHTIQTGSSGGYDEDGNLSGDATLNALVTQGQTYTIITTTMGKNEQGAYRIQWPDWIQLTGAGT
ncbi:MAG: hypothetical protein ACHQ50_09465 [Fimbriimonadales bacterium]